MKMRLKMSPLIGKESLKNISTEPRTFHANTIQSVWTYFISPEWDAKQAQTQKFFRKVIIVFQSVTPYTLQSIVKTSEKSFLLQK